MMTNSSNEFSTMVPPLWSPPRASDNPNLLPILARGGDLFWAVAEVDRHEFNKGYLIVPRSLLSIKRPRLRNLLISCYGLAAYKERRDPLTGIVLQAGQLLKTISYLAEFTGLTYWQTRSRLRELEQRNLLLLLTNEESTNGQRSANAQPKAGILITVCDYMHLRDMNAYHANEEPKQDQRSANEEQTQAQPLLIEANRSIQEQKNKKIHMSSADDPSPLIQDLVDLWNEICGPHSLPRVKRVSNKRKIAARARLKELPDLKQWRQVFEHIASDPFHLGGSERNWRANFDYIMRPDKAQRILELLEAGESEYYEDKHGY